MQKSELRVPTQGIHPYISILNKLNQFSALWLQRLAGNVASTKPNMRANGTCFVALLFPGLFHDFWGWWEEGPGHIPLVLSAFPVGQGDHKSWVFFFFSWGQSIKVWQKIPSFDCGNLVNFEIRQDLSLHCMFRELLSASEEYPKIHRSSGRRAGRSRTGDG